MLPLFHNGHMGTEIIENGGQLHGNHPAADDGEPVKAPGLGRQQPVAVPYPWQIRSRNSLHYRNRSRGNHHIPALEKFLSALRQIHLHCPISAQNAISINNIHALLPEGFLYTRPVLFHRLVLVLLHLAKVKGNKIREYPEGIAALHHVKQPRCVEQRLGGDAAPVHTGPPHLSPLNHCRPHAKLRRLQSGRIAARSGSYHQKIILLCHLSASFLSFFCSPFRQPLLNQAPAESSTAGQRTASSCMPLHSRLRKTRMPLPLR